MAGQVRVEGAPATKPGTSVSEGTLIEVDEGRRFVSRGGEKLANALERFDVTVTGRRALDVGASTGGFTDVMLREGAIEVIALDVGYGQLAWELRTDERVHVRERTNARDLAPGSLPFTPGLVTIDVSFISLRTVWPAVHGCLGTQWEALVLVKPQFEVGRERVGSGGVVRDPGLRAEAAKEVSRAVEATGAGVRNAADSGVPGPKGNREIFLHVTPQTAPEPSGADALIEAAAVLS